jgi:hypothetical protein
MRRRGAQLRNPTPPDAVRCGAASTFPTSRLRAAAFLTIPTIAVAACLLPVGAAAPGQPRTFLLNPETLVATKAAIARGDAAVMPAWEALRADAAKALTAGPFSVMNKPVAPPSGDRHDYMSQAPYFWPNPGAAGGLPYIRKDGERNPEIDRITDHRAIDGVVANSETLSLAYFYSGDERYAARAAALIRAFYLDPATRMNPNLEYAQFIPGVNTGRGIGLIETRGFTRVVDAVGLIEGSAAWRDADGRGLREWFAAFLGWMQTSRNGRDEAAAKNNHGTYYDLQVASFALFLGRTPLARQILEAAKAKRIAVQIEADGRQPLELARTNAWSYSNGNLDGLTELATLGDRAGVDLWHFATPDGRSIRAAILYLVPFAFGEKRWEAPQINGFNGEALHTVLRRAGAHYDDEELRRAVARLPPLAPAHRLRLR